MLNTEGKKSKQHERRTDLAAFLLPRVVDVLVRVLGMLANASLHKLAVAHHSVHFKTFWDFLFFDVSEIVSGKEALCDATVIHTVSASLGGTLTPR